MYGDNDYAEIDPRQKMPEAIEIAYTRYLNEVMRVIARTEQADAQQYPDAPITAPPFDLSTPMPSVDAQIIQFPTPEDPLNKEALARAEAARRQIEQLGATG